MKTKQLYDPALIDRGDDGQFWHPDLPFPDGAEMESESVDISAAIDAQGYTYQRVLAPDEVSGDNSGDDAFWQKLRAWQPEPPAGDGWLLSCIADSEDGPAAWFVRPKDCV